MSDYHRRPAAPGSHLPAPAVFLGALASEVNEPDVLSPAFAAVADLTERIVAAVRTTALPEREAAEHLSHLRITDDQGAHWAVGATSLRWYRKLPGRAWKLAVPPEFTDAASEASSAAAVSALPPQVLDIIGGREADWEAGGYAVDPFAVAAPAPAPWEFEVGDDRRLQAYGDVPFPTEG